MGVARLASRESRREHGSASHGVIGFIGPPRTNVIRTSHADPPPPPHRREPHGGPRASALVGRATELAILRAAFESASEGRGTTIVLTGEPGVGKTRLLREIRTWCTEQGAAVLPGRAVEAGPPVPFRPLMEALLVADRIGAIHDEPDVRPFRAALAPLIPAGSPDVPPSLGAPLPHVAEGFLRVARARGRAARGAVVLLDDLQWADAESLAVLEYLADNVSDEPVLVVATARDDPQAGSTEHASTREHPQLDPLMGLVDRRAAIPVRLGRLTAEQTAEMTKSCLGDALVPPQVPRLVRDRADGLPFLVEELLAQLVRDGTLVKRHDAWSVVGSRRPSVPVSVVESARRRFASLDATSARILLDAALLGRRVDATLLASTADADERDVTDAVHAGVERGLLEVAGGQPRFRDELTREALVAVLPPAERAARARHVLAVLLDARPGLSGELDDGRPGLPGELRVARATFPDELAEVAADLAEVAGQPALAAELLLRVGRRALRGGAFITAETALRRAVRLADGTPVELSVREALVSTLAVAGRADEAVPEGEALLDRLGEADPDRTRRRAVHLALARCAVTLGAWPAAAAHLDQAADPADGDQSSAAVTAAVTAALRAAVALGEHRLADAHPLAAAAVEAAERSGDANARAEALLVFGACARLHDAEEARHAFEHALAVARRAGLAHHEARALAELGFAPSVSGVETTLLAEAKRLAEACGAPETEALAELTLATSAWCRADPDSVSAHATTAARLARRYRLGRLLPAALVTAASAHAMRGEREEMDILLAEALPALDERAEELVAVHAQCRAACALARDDLAEARGELRRARELARVARPPTVPPLLALDAVLHAVGGSDPAELIGELRGWRRTKLPQPEAILTVAEAVRLGREGEGTVAEALLAGALRILAPNPFVHALTARLVAPIASADGWGEPIRWLTAALATFEERGLRGPAEACRADLRRLGQPVRRGDGELTAREREVLDLVAQGLPNREVAARLFLSARTVEKHVERLLAKTGSANRAQLATFALGQR
jgi:DNA-binding CsgD family transcriptional regulator/tetratricopeptide (TPR) repeat protein